LLSEYDISKIDKIYYPSQNETTRFATCGDCDDGATTINVGPFATGELQRAMAFYSEATFVCPSYWLASAFQKHQSSYKYQLSVVPGFHGMDLYAESLVDYPNAAVNIGPDFHLALTAVWGNMIRTGNPSISLALADGNSTNSTAQNPASHWPKFTPEGEDSWRMINLNQTGGMVSETFAPLPELPAVRQYEGIGLTNNFRNVDGHSWEGGQGERCDFLRSIGERIPI
jgi:hypothetical protein